MSTVNAPPLAMTDGKRSALGVIARSMSLGHHKLVQAKALLLAGDGVGTNEVARQCHTSNESVRAWRRRFEAECVDRVGRIALGRSRTSWLPEGTVAAVVHYTLHAVPMTTRRTGPPDSWPAGSESARAPSPASCGTTISNPGGSTPTSS